MEQIQQVLSFATNPLVWGILILGFLTWLIVMFQIWLDPDRGFLAKFLWTIANIFLWPITTPLYGIINYHSIKKAIPIIILAANAWVYVTMASHTSDMMYFAAREMLQQKVEHPQIQHFVTERLDVLENENGLSQKEKGVALATYLIHLLDDEDGLTRAELKKWAGAYNQRKDITVQQIQVLILQSQQN